MEGREGGREEERKKEGRKGSYILYVHLVRKCTTLRYLL